MRALTSLLALACLSGFAAAAGLRGNVVDMTTRKGVPGVKIILLSMDGRKIHEVVTNGLGVYSFPDVPKGTYTIRVEPTGFRPDPDLISNQRVENDPDNAPPCELWPLSAMKSQYIQGGAFLARKAMEDKTTYATFWKKLGPGEMLPINKFHIIAGIKETDNAAEMKWKPFRHYLAANPASINRAQTVFNATVRGEGKMPSSASLSDLRLDEVVIADVVTFELRNSRLSMPAKEQFFLDYRRNMGKAGSVLILENWLKQAKASKFDLP